MINEEDGERPNEETERTRRLKKRKEEGNGDLEGNRRLTTRKGTEERKEEEMIK